MNAKPTLLPLLLVLALWGVGGQGACAQTHTNVSTNSTATNQPAAPPPHVRAGLRLELVADESLVQSPVAMAFDERGRLFVAEMRDDPASPSGRTLSGRVRLLEDADGDGVFDTSVVFADNLDRPSAIACSRGGVFVAGPSKLSFSADLDGDGIADLNRTLLSFRISPSPESSDQFPHAMRWGPDRRIYVALPSADAEVLNPNAPNQPPLKLWGGGFSFDPLTLNLRTESGAGVVGQAFDDAGRRFVWSSTEALAVTVLNGFEAQRNPYAPLMPASAVVVPARRTGAPSDCLIYRGNGYPTNLQGQAFLADPGSRAVYLVALREGPTHPTAVPREGILLVPLISGQGTSFRPMQLVTGPDDYVYVADLGRQASAENQSLSSNPAAAEAGTSGRIWRLVPAERSVGGATPPDFSNALSLITALGSSNAWMRSTAARLLLERRLTNAVPDLRKVLTRGKWAVARLEALRSLNALGATTGRDLSQAMSDPDPAVRAAAVGMTAGWVKDGQLAGSLWDALRLRSTDPAGQVRLQVALVLGSVTMPPSSALLSDLYESDLAEPWLRRAMLTGSPETMTPLFMELLQMPRVRQSPSGRELLVNLASSIGLGGEHADVSDCLRAVGDLNTPADPTFPIIAGLAEGLEGRGLRLPEADREGLWPGIARAAQAVAVRGEDVQIRTEAVKILGACANTNLVTDRYLLLMFAPGLPEPLQIPVIQALGQQGLHRDFEALAQRWHLWAAPEQLATLDALLQTENGTDALLTALDNNTIPVEALTSVHINLLRQYPVEDIRARARRFFGPAQPDRKALVSDFLGAVKLAGSVARGRELFDARCAYCHQSGTWTFGPPPEAMRAQSASQLVAGVIDPSREIALGYQTTVLGLPHGRIVWGVARDVNADVIGLITPAGTRRYLRKAVSTLDRPDWSLMPDNIAAGLTRQDLADLVQFIRSSGAPR